MRRFIGGALMVVVLATSCGDDSGKGNATEPPVSTSSAAVTTTSTTTSSSTTTTTTEAPPSDEEQIIAVVERFYEVLGEANDPPVLDNPVWDEVATPDLADGLRLRAVENLEKRVGLRQPGGTPPAVIAATVLAVDGPIAYVEFCLRDDAVMYDLDTNEVLNDDVIFGWVQHELRRIGDRWLVSRTTDVQRFDEESECVDSLS